MIRETIAEATKEIATTQGKSVVEHTMGYIGEATDDIEGGQDTHHEGHQAQQEATKGIKKAAKQADVVTVTALAGLPGRRPSRKPPGRPSCMPWRLWS